MADQNISRKPGVAAKVALYWQPTVVKRNDDEVPAMWSRVWYRSPRHGKRHTYLAYGCRCERCRIAQAEYTARNRFA